MLNDLCWTLYYLAPWLIPTAAFALISAYLVENTAIGDILIDLLRRLSK